DRCRRSVFQYGNGSDVERVQEIDIARYAVDQHQWVAAINGGESSDVDLRVAARTPVAEITVQVGDSALKGLPDARDGPVFQHFGVDLRDRTGQVLPFLRAVSHHHDLVERLYVGFKRDIDRRLTAGWDLPADIAYIGKNENSGRIVDGDGVVAFQV